MNKIIKRILYTLVSLYLLICVGLYFFQEKLIFAPYQLPANYEFNFPVKFQELNIKTHDAELLSGVLFKADSSKGLIFYLHGNGGCIAGWGEISKVYTDLHYDLFELDYRGYGKSTGKIRTEKEMFNDVQTAYDSLKHRYPENKIIVLGYSLGTGLAAKLASTNHPKQLILQAPYYNIKYMMQKELPIIPTFILRYKFATNEYIPNCKMPITIFHGDADQLIPYECSVELIKLAKPTDEFITLKGRGHNGMSDNPEYVTELKRILASTDLNQEITTDAIGTTGIVNDSIVKLKNNQLKKFTVDIKVTIDDAISSGIQILITRKDRIFKEINPVKIPCPVAFDLNSTYLVRCTKIGYTTKVISIDTHVPDGREAEEFAEFKMEVNLHKTTATDKTNASTLAGSIAYNQEEQDFNKVEK